MYKTTLPSEWGTLFGLAPSDLTDEQLNKLAFPKLLEFLGADPRVETIICNKMAVVPVKELYRFQEMEEQLANINSFKSGYNDLLRTRRHEIDKNINDYYYGRNKMILWNLLDDDNKKYELSRWTSGISSIINEDTLDFKWLYSQDKVIADSIVEKILNKRNYNASPPLMNMIEFLPKEEYLRWLPKIFEKGKYIFIHVLANENTPDDYILKTLRYVAKLTHPPKIKVKISNAILNELPPVTRLEVLEKIIYSCNRNNIYLPFTEIKTSEDLKQMLFSAMTRHYDRVSNLVNSFNKVNNKSVLEI